MELIRGEPWYLKGTVFDFHLMDLDESSNVALILDGLNRIFQGGSSADCAVWTSEVSNSDAFRSLKEEIKSLGLKWLIDVDLGHQETHAMVVARLAYWLEKGIGGFKSGLDNNRWLELSADSETLCGRLTSGHDIDELEDRYFELPGLSGAFARCTRHPAHRVAGLDLSAIEWGGRSYKEFLSSFDEHLAPDDWPRYSATGLEQAWLAGGLSALKARLLMLMLLTLKGTPVVPALVMEPEGTVLAREDRNPNSNVNFLRHMVALRSLCPALWTGDYHGLNLEVEDVLGYVRETERQRITVLLNFSARPVEIELNGQVGEWIAGTQQVQGDGRLYGDGPVTLDGFEGRVYERRRLR